MELRDYEREEKEYARKNLEPLERVHGDVDPSVKLLGEAMAIRLAKIRQTLDLNWSIARRALADEADPFPYDVIPARLVLQVSPSAGLGRGARRVLGGSRFKPKRSTDMTEADAEIRYRTIRELDVWPIRVVGLACTGDRLRLALGLTSDDAGLRFSDLQGFDRLVLFVDGPPANAFPFHEALIRGNGGEGPAVRPVGFDGPSEFLPPVHGLMPGAARLSELLLFPDAFRFVEVSGLAPAASAANGRGLEVDLRLGGGRRIDAVPEGVALLTNCVPAVNLVAGKSPVQVERNRDLHPVVPAAQKAAQYEAASVDKVTEAGTPLHPRGAVKHAYAGAKPVTYYEAIRPPADPGDPAGRRLYLRLIDRGAAGVSASERWVEAHVTWCHGDRPVLKPFVSWELVDDGLAASSVTRPSPPLRAPEGEFGLRVAANNLVLLRDLRQLGLVAPEAGAAVVRGLLRHRGLCDWSPSPEFADDGLTAALADTVVGATAGRGDDDEAGRPVKLVTLTLDETKAPGAPVHLFTRALHAALSDLNAPAGSTSLRVLSKSKEPRGEWSPLDAAPERNQQA